MKYRYQGVVRTPATLIEGIVYHNEDFELATLLCACGCGHRITLMVPDSHEVFDHAGMATVRPSIGVFDAPCLSHFIISAGDVKMLEPFSARQASGVMQRQVARHLEVDNVRAPWWVRMISRLRRLVGI